MLLSSSSLRLAALLGAALLGGTSAQPWPFQNTSLPFWDRAADLVSRLTLAQQVELLLAQDARTGGVPEFNISDYNWWTECNSGIGVEYPQNINMAATFNRSLAFLAGRGTGVGLRKQADAAVQDISCWSPMMNVARHPFWGRAHEGYGEDPFLSGEMGYQNVLGIQGFGLEGYPKFSLANTGCKHFSAFNGPENWGSADIDDYDWLLNYLPQFERCVDAGSFSVMCAYSSVQGRSGCANDRAMQTILRDTWGHDGFVVSDCGAVGGSPADAVQSIEAGTDLECNPWGQSVYPSLVNSTLAGNVSQAVIAQAAKRLLYVRFRLGHWDPPETVPFADKATYGLGADMSLYEQVSLEAARQSIVLLKNDGILPLARPGAYATIAALGILDCMSAGYDTAGDGNFNKTLVSAALAAAFPASRVQVGMGCGCPLDQADCEQCPGCNWAPAGLMATCTNYNATNTTLGAAGADLVVLHLGFGGRPGENTDIGSGKEQEALDLYPNQTQLVGVALATGKPVILVLFTALPCNITGLVANPQIRAVIQAYYPQHHGGTAVVDVLTGAVNPAGRLVMTWPKAYNATLHGDIDDYRMLGTQKTYRFGFPDPLFPFGFGLSYTSWSYSALTVSGGGFGGVGVVSGAPIIIAPCANVSVSVTVTNTGAVDGSEVVQLYVRWRDVVGGDAPVPSITLADFARVFVAAGASVTVPLVVDARHWAVLQAQPPGPPSPKEPNGSWVPPAWTMKPATLDLFVGGQQPFATPRLASNVLSASVALAGDGSPASRCPRYVPHDHRGVTKHA